MEIKFQSSVIFVKDIQTSRHFYEDLLNQKVSADFGLNVGFEAGFAIWQSELAYQTIFGSPVNAAITSGCKNSELYFETDDLYTLLEQITKANVQFVHPLREQPWAQRVFRIYDPDGHIVELGEPMPVVVSRLLSEGMSAQEIAQRTSMPFEMVQQMVQTVISESGV
jgi:catechol 2,3-dioxygenase-like lactoylglutathione lyase family enzyme